jgi:hypothetical protein
MAIKEISDLDDSTKKENKFIFGADMKKAKQNRGGRPKKSQEDKANEVVTANVTVAEKEAIETSAKQMGISVSALIKISLNKFI